MCANTIKSILSSRKREKKPVDHEGGQKLTFLNQLAFGCCGPPYQLSSTAIGFFFASVFLLEVARLPPIYVSIIVLTGRFWDAITDPIVGHLVNVTQSKRPSLKKWCCINTPVLGLSYFFLWIVPPLPLPGRFCYYAIMYMLFQTSLTCLNVPSNVMLMYITKTQSDRDKATTTKMTIELFSIVVSMVVQNTAFILINEKQEDACATVFVSTAYGALDMMSNSTTAGMSLFNGSNTSIGGYAAAAQDGFLSSLSSQPMENVVSDQLLQSWKKSYAVAGGVITSLIVISMVFFVCGNDETINYESKETRRQRLRSAGSAPVEIKESFRGALLLIMRYKPFQILTVAYLFLALSLQLIQTNFVLYLKIVMNRPDTYYFPLLCLLLSAFLSVPLWYIVLRWFTKRRTFIMGNFCLITPVIAMFFLPASMSIYQLSFWCIFAGVGVANAYLLPWSMLPDVMEHYRLTHGARHEGLFYGVFVFFTKFAVGIAQGISQLVLYSVGYDNGACYQTEKVSFAIKCLVAPTPTLFMFTSIFVLFRFKLHLDYSKRRTSYSNSSSEPQSEQRSDDGNLFAVGKEACEVGDGGSLALVNSEDDLAMGGGEDNKSSEASSTGGDMNCLANTDNMNASMQQSSDYSAEVTPSVNISTPLSSAADKCDNRLTNSDDRISTV